MHTNKQVYNVYEWLYELDTEISVWYPEILFAQI